MIFRTNDRGKTLYFTAVVCHQTLQSPKKKKTVKWGSFLGAPQEEAPTCSSLVAFFLSPRAPHTPQSTWFVSFAVPLRPLRLAMLPTKRVSGKVVALALAVFAASWCFSFAASEYEYAVLDDVPSAAPRSVQTVTPPRLLSSTTDQNTGLRVDTYVKPLGVLRPGEVLNTDPTGELGKLLRPKMNSTDEPMLVVRLTFDLVHGDTFEPLPLDRLYNHHLVIYSRPDMEGGKREKPTEKENKGGKTKKPTEKEGGFRDNPGAALVVGALAKGEYFPFTTFHRLSGPITLTVYSYTLRETDTFMLIVSGLSQMNLSAVLAPCGVGTYFSGGGAEWRGKRKRQDDLLKIDPVRIARFPNPGTLFAHTGLTLSFVYVRPATAVSSTAKTCGSTRLWRTGV
jgi:hypothetical protein